MRSYSCSVSTQIGGEVRTHLIAQNALDHVEIVIDQRRGFAALGARLDFVPQTFQEANVGAQFFFARPCAAVRTMNPPCAVFPLAHE